MVKAVGMEVFNPNAINQAEPVYVAKMEFEKNAKPSFEYQLSYSICEFSVEETRDSFRKEKH